MCCQHCLSTSTFHSSFSINRNISLSLSFNYVINMYRMGLKRPHLRMTRYWAYNGSQSDGVGYVSRIAAVEGLFLVEKRTEN